jgi:DNA anti-recombination protein RmuC
MSLQIEFWELMTFLVTLLITFFSAVWAFARFTTKRTDAQLNQRFQAQAEAVQRIETKLGEQERAREAGQHKWGDRFAALDKEMADHRERIARIETAQKQSPTHEDLAQLHERINDVRGTLDQLVGEFRGAKENLGLIHEFLLRGDDKS